MCSPGDIADPLEAAALQQLLVTRTFGRTLHIVSQTASTNDDAKILAQRGAPEGTVLLAEQQTHGRGRQGRTFASPAGVGIYLSLIVRPLLPPAQLPQLTFMAAVAAAEAITGVCAVPVALKWPNDVEVGGKKVAGILTEAMLCPGGSLAVIIGIGINVNTSLEQLPCALRHKVSSLALAVGSAVARAPLIALLLAQLERLYGIFLHTGVAPILERWRHYGRMAGRRVRYATSASMQDGTAVGVDDDGALLILTVAGEVQRIIAGEISFL
jgi:BirA family transcriptional regulator, biotin operon repressor / biotin---[acetyl-CoA-carboxylase] ligase